jgi:hypothetical protein
MDTPALYLTDTGARHLPPAERRAHRAAFLAMLHLLGIPPRLDLSGVLMAPLADLARGLGVSPDEVEDSTDGALVVYCSDPADLVALH